MLINELYIYVFLVAKFEFPGIEYRATETLGPNPNIFHGKLIIIFGNHWPSSIRVMRRTTDASNVNITVMSLCHSIDISELPLIRKRIEYYTISVNVIALECFSRDSACIKHPIDSNKLQSYTFSAENGNSITERRTLEMPRINRREIDVTCNGKTIGFNDFPEHPFASFYLEH